MIITARPFKLTLVLATPFFQNHRLTLDGLLSAAIFKKTGSCGEDSIPLIPLVSEKGIFKASSLFCHPQYRSLSFGRIGTMRKGADLSSEEFAPNKRGGKQYTFIDQARGPYKSMMTEYLGISSQEVYFWGVGDPDAVEYLINNYLLGIGKRSNAGAGEILSVNYTEIEEDLSWVTRKGLPARPLPVEVWRTISEVELPTVPLRVNVPYYRSEEVQAVFPKSYLV